MSTEFLHWLLVASLVASPPSLARAKNFRDFIPTRDRSLSRSSLFLFKDMADESDTYTMHRSQSLRRYTGLPFGEIDFAGVLDNGKGLCVRFCCPRDATCSTEALFIDQIEVLRETISVEEELEGGVLLESWFGSALDTWVDTKENTFWLYVMAQSPGSYNILAKTFKVECVIQCTAAPQWAGGRQIAGPAAKRAT
ncbi:hypothetical protein DFH09DRAFT_1316662 [Mycena vulgaris]|nr:hypothetical protein DFH09DRAFT_1316662 [Mycena vulgaris]